MLFKVVPMSALAEPYGPAPTWGGVAPGGFSRGPETYWQGAYWAPEEPSPYTNPGECADLCMYVLCLPSLRAASAGGARCGDTPKCARAVKMG